MEPEELIDAGDRVVVVVRQSGRGKVSGAEVNAVLYQVATVREGKVLTVDVYLDRRPLMRMLRGRYPRFA